MARTSKKARDRGLRLWGKHPEAGLEKVLGEDDLWVLSTYRFSASLTISADLCCFFSECMSLSSFCMLGSGVFPSRRCFCVLGAPEGARDTTAPF